MERGQGFLILVQWIDFCTGSHQLHEKCAPPKNVFANVYFLHMCEKGSWGSLLWVLRFIDEYLKKTAKKLENHLIRESKTAGQASCKSPGLLGRGREVGSAAEGCGKKEG